MAKEGRFDRFCTVCGKHYEYCPTCSRFAHMERWHDAYCSANCKDLYNVAAGFINHWQEPEVEATRLQKLDLSYIGKLPLWMQTTIKDIQRVELNNVDKTPVEEQIAEIASKEPKTDEIKKEEVVEKFEAGEKNDTVQSHKFEKKVNAQNKYNPNKFGKKQ